MRNLTERINDAHRVTLKAEVVQETTAIEQAGVFANFVHKVLEKAGIRTPISLGRKERSLVELDSVPMWERIQMRNDVFASRQPHPLRGDHESYYEFRSQRTALPGMQEDIDRFLADRRTNAPGSASDGNIYVQVGLRGNHTDGDQFLSVRFYNQGGPVHDRENGLLYDTGSLIEDFDALPDIDKAFYVSLVEATGEVQNDQMRAESILEFARQLDRPY